MEIAFDGYMGWPILFNLTEEIANERFELILKVRRTPMLEKPAPQRSLGAIVWFTGLSGAGKSRIAQGVHDGLLQEGMQVELLDGDVLRQTINRGLGFSREDRDENVRRIGYIASLIARHGVIVLVAAIAPYRSTRDELRQLNPNFVEVFVDAPLHICEDRDPKGLYRRARSGELPHFTGIDSPYEEPLTPHIHCKTACQSEEESIAHVLLSLKAIMQSQDNQVQML